MYMNREDCIFLAVTHTLNRKRGTFGTFEALLCKLVFDASFNVGRPDADAVCISYELLRALISNADQVRGSQANRQSDED